MGMVIISFFSAVLQLVIKPENKSKLTTENKGRYVFNFIILFLNMVFSFTYPKNTAGFPDLVIHIGCPNVYYMSTGSNFLR